MRFEWPRKWLPSPLWVRVGSGVLWILLITGAHWQLNISQDPLTVKHRAGDVVQGRGAHGAGNADDAQGGLRTVAMGYMPVVTNIAAPLLDHVSKAREDVRFNAMKFASFAEMAEALRNRDIDVGFMIAPLPIVMRQKGEDVKVIMVGNRHESTLVAAKSLHARSLDDLVGKTIAVPMRFSGHNLGLLRLIEDRGLAGRINIVEMNPPDMAAGLAAGSLDAYFVGEPFAAKSVKGGLADVVDYVEDFWPDFMCNVVVVHNDLITRDPELVQRLVTSAARAVTWAGAHPEEAAEIASPYWTQPKELITYAMNTPPGRVRFNHYVPIEYQFREMATLMVRFGLTGDSDTEGLVEDRFSKAADVLNITDLDSILVK